MTSLSHATRRDFVGGNIKKRFQFLVSEETAKLVTFKLVNEGVIPQEM